MWISYSERPLKVEEICHALAVEIGSSDINANNVPSIRTVLVCCQGLVAVDKGSSTVRLIHFTLKEYLSCHAALFDGAHSKIAESCLTYLNFQTIKNLPVSVYTRGGIRRTPYPGSDKMKLLLRPPLLQYSSFYWGTHMRMDPSDHSRRLARDLLNQ